LTVARWGYRRHFLTDAGIAMEARPPFSVLQVWIDGIGAGPCRAVLCTHPIVGLAQYPFLLDCHCKRLLLRVEAATEARHGRAPDGSSRT
jgi:hypothetical protein